MRGLFLFGASRRLGRLFASGPCGGFLFWASRRLGRFFASGALPDRLRIDLVIARRAEPDAAIHGYAARLVPMDCFVAPLLAMTREGLNYGGLNLGELKRNRPSALPKGPGRGISPPARV